MSSFAGGRQPDRNQRKLLGEAGAFAGRQQVSKPVSSRLGPEPAVIFDQVSTTIDGRRALSLVSLEIAPGSLTVVTGLTGLGKAAFVEHLLARRVPTNGEVTVLGWSIRELPSDVIEGRRPAVGVVPRDSGLLSSRSVFDNAAILLQNGSGLPNAEIDARVTAILESLDLLEVADALPGELAMGQRKIVALARALTLSPALVIFDEPEAGMDRMRARLMMDVISSLKSGDPATTYLVLTQDLPLGCSIAERLVLFNHGCTVAAGTVPELSVSENPHVRALLQEAVGVGPTED